MTTPQKLVDKMLKDYEETKSVHRTAKRVGLGSTTVHRILRANGIECDGLAIHRKRIRKLPAEDILLAEYNAGASGSVIAKKYGCKSGTVHEALKKAGAVMRPRGNWVKVVTEDEAKEIVVQYKQLGSQAAVATLRGTSQTRVSKALRMMGVACGRMSGANHPSWKGGKGPAPGGYIGVNIAVDDPLRCIGDRAGRVMEHRLVMARSLGRPLTSDETVHHIDGDPENNDISNLQLRFGKHGKGVVMVCAKCGSSEISYKELS